MFETISLVFIATNVTIDKAHTRCNMNTPKERLEAVLKRIERACAAAGRQPVEVSLLAVSKRHGCERIRTFNSLGLVAFGENQVQEALQKQQDLHDLGLEWHFIGTVQSNKTHALAEHFQWVQSVDRAKILKRLAAQRPDSAGVLNICLQVNIDDEPQKAGATPAEIIKLADLAQGFDTLRLRGLMAIPRLTSVVEEQRHSFRLVRKLYEQLKAAGHDLDTLSMGMSADLEAAIAEGSTMVRIGTDLLGERPS
jgi:pyridoxal phosphate enzyme (YggS family)